MPNPNRGVLHISVKSAYDVGALNLAATFRPRIAHVSRFRQELLSEHVTAFSLPPEKSQMVRPTTTCFNSILLTSTLIRPTFSQFLFQAKQQPLCPAIRTATMSSATTFYDFKTKDKKGQPFPLSSLKGKVVLVINTASKCGFTPQFAGLETLYKDLKKAYPNDVEFLGFPCNQFAGQDPGSDDDIQSFCQLNYGVTFPVLAKTDVNGDKAEPVWEWMKGEKPGIMGLKRIKWNFEKFLIGKDGKVKGRWASTTDPAALKAPIEEELKKAGAKKVDSPQVGK
ncbi:Glutathione peroxidase-like protein [Elsinoe fawcettii]|nr:Glutathione peroxidase-like protein [Elsinoe fawcettii]